MADLDFNRKHPRDEDGKFTNKHGGAAAGSRERLENIYDSDKRGVLEKEKKKNTLTDKNNTAKLPSSIKIKGFKDDDLREHFIDHHKDFGVKNEAEYNEMAKRFIDSTDGELYIAIIYGKKRYYRFNPITTEFGAISEDGVLITYYKPKHGDINAARNYVDKDMRKKGAKRI